MKITSIFKNKELFLKSLVLACGLALGKLAMAAPATGPLNLTQIPLANASSTIVKPNVMFILDDSGSMTDDSLPDWAISYEGIDYLYRNTDFNGVAYNPAVSYEKPVFFNADGTLNTTNYPSQIGTSNATGASTLYPLPNWRKVKKDGYNIIDTGTSDFQNNAYYYTVISGEFCKERDLKECVAAVAPTAAYPYAAPLRWCNNSTNATSAAVPSGGNLCQSINDSSHTNPRYPTPRVSTITVNSSGDTTVSGLTISGQQIMSAATSTKSVPNDLAVEIAQKINNCTYAMTGTCATLGYSATASGNTVTIKASRSAGLADITATPVISSSGSMTFATTAFAKINNVPGKNVITHISPATTAYTYPGAAAKDPARTDCAGTTCTFSEEMINYANWHAYYRTRMQAMKTSVSRAFKSIDHRYRVGFTTINNSDYSSTSQDFQALDTFQLAHKNAWYQKLFDTNTPASTPLRSALSKVGRMYANKLPGAPDPIQYSCQQNFAILSTDGYWNSDSPSDVKNLTGGSVGNLDISTATAPVKRPYWEGPTASSASLADVARYYYLTDLRTSALNNCTSGSSTGETLCSNVTNDPYNNVYVNSNDPLTTQHMVTFTMGLGVDGTLNYTSDYADATSGDFYRLKNGVSPTVNWPVPAQNSPTAVDDLWHAAVNGNGTYFSAKKPNDIIDGFAKGLASITAKLGSGAAAATSTLNPVAGNNFAYVASYTTNSWTGNLEARTINVLTGAVSESATWCVEDVVGGSCSTPLVLDSSGGGKVYNCTDGGVTTEMPIACSGRMNQPGVTTATTDNRKIWTKGPGASTLNNFNATSGALNPADFSAAKLATLSQWTVNPNTGAPFTPAQQTAAVGNIIGYLRGQSGYENISSNLTGSGASVVDNRLFRKRDATLGDAIESQPAFVGKSTFGYLDSGYSAFKGSTASRAGTVYMGANDGMMHAFDANTGDERWAYVPSMLIPNMIALADTNFSTNHLYFANGSPIISDVQVGGVWKTILVAGLNGGGRGYYALDITNPTSPSLLWEFTPADDPDLGYTFGAPVITKKDNGDWVVLVTSGYNNIPDTSPRVRFPRVNTGNGDGYLYVLNAGTGVKISKIATGVGSTTVPSGLAQISAYVDSDKNNSAMFVYGGDLLGNVWRFDINTASVAKFAVLTDGGTPQPITTAPELGDVMSSDGKVRRVVFVGTGKYLETNDLTDTQLQTLYGIKDVDEPGSSVTPTLVNPRSYASASSGKMVEQKLTVSGSKRNVTNNQVNLQLDRGWFLDFASPGERQNVASKLVQGTLLVPTTMPSNTACNPGGSSWLNYFNYSNGGAVDPANPQASTWQNAPIVGLNVMYIPDAATGKLKPIISVVTSDHPTPEIVSGPKFGFGFAFQKRRAVWQEVISK